MWYAIALGICLLGLVCWLLAFRDEPDLHVGEVWDETHRVPGRFWGVGVVEQWMAEGRWIRDWRTGRDIEAWGSWAWEDERAT